MKVLRRWAQAHILTPLSALTPREGAAVLCLGLHTGIFPVPGGTMACLAVCMMLVRRLPLFRSIPPAVLSAVSAAVNLALTPIQLAAIPVFVRLSESWSLGERIDRIVASCPRVGVQARGFGTENDDGMAAQAIRNAVVLLQTFGAASLAWMLTTILMLPLWLLLAVALDWRTLASSTFWWRIASHEADSKTDRRR